MTPHGKQKILRKKPKSRHNVVGQGFPARALTLVLQQSRSGDPSYFAMFFVKFARNHGQKEALNVAVTTTINQST
jgi:hypothetical protein